MEENQQNKKGNIKGLIILIALVVVAVAAYFIVQSINSNGDGQTISISEEDRLELSSLNLFGKWNKPVGTDRYELNFKSNHTLVLTQYDANGEVVVKSDEGTFSVDDGILNLTVVAGGAPITASCNAVVSSENLVITIVEGSDLFAGGYTRDMGDMPNIDSGDTDNSSSDSNNSTDNSSNSSTDSKPTQSSGTDSSSDTTSDPTDNEFHLPAIVDTLFSKTESEYPPSTDEYGKSFVTDGQYTVYLYYDYSTGYPEEISIDIDQLFPELDSYTYNDLKNVLGDKLTYSLLQVYDEFAYNITAIVDGYVLDFCKFPEHIQYVSVYSLDDEVNCCRIIPLNN